MLHIFDRIVKLELYWNWSLGHINIPLQALQTFLLLKISFGSYLWAAVSVLAALVLITIVGWFGVEKGLFKRQNSILNQHNLELLQASKGGKEL